MIVPAHNEAAQVPTVLQGLRNAGWEHIIVVDDGSTDDTAALARAGGAVVLSHSINRGQGAALETGMEYARWQCANLVVHFDGDGQFNPQDIKGAAQYLAERGLDAVLGSRFLDSRSQVPWLKRLLLLTVARWVNWLFTGVYLSDAHNGFRVLGPRALSAIRISQSGMAHNSEIVAALKKHNLSFAEYPVQVVYHHYGQELRSGFGIVWNLLRERLSRVVGG